MFHNNPDELSLSDFVSCATDLSPETASSFVETPNTTATTTPQTALTEDTVTEIESHRRDQLSSSISSLSDPEEASEEAEAHNAANVSLHHETEIAPTSSEHKSGLVEQDIPGTGSVNSCPPESHAYASIRQSGSGDTDSVASNLIKSQRQQTNDSMSPLSASEDDVPSASAPRPTYKHAYEDNDDRLDEPSRRTGQRSKRFSTASIASSITAMVPFIWGTDDKKDATTRSSSVGTPRAFSQNNNRSTSAFTAGRVPQRALHRQANTQRISMLMQRAAMNSQTLKCLPIESKTVASWSSSLDSSFNSFDNSQFTLAVPPSLKENSLQDKFQLANDQLLEAERKKKRRPLSSWRKSFWGGAPVTTLDDSISSLEPSVAADDEHDSGGSRPTTIGEELSRKAPTITSLAQGVQETVSTGSNEEASITTQNILDETRPMPQVIPYDQATVPLLKDASPPAEQVVDQSESHAHNQSPFRIKLSKLISRVSEKLHKAPEGSSNTLLAIKMNTGGAGTSRRHRFQERLRKAFPTRV